ncbi:hypothetical protein CLUG_02624 [Clavispora lusitaniae ATCC 42720]|uniref:Uncharacterized protein n=2 Tax=Clavispora lusitaniae TaxID=36911 RepID=C4Y4Q2_CLAL4|nr:uncharacterized protein CLUG_02624 [Clavispora lusitaniae ATCC 42720]EEQ38498.1 hypothetical protein CLUG_02624 [Clavispora lusitaniae ATCC 42720]KAF5211285.1 hypothetical protein E0198_002588 [Clavispora lusitaniae]OVF08767.1 hypothetical protein A9F13_07g02431 [Clavispora lusitaniae]
MSPRKSCRQRTLTTKGQQQNEEKTNKAVHIVKRRRLSPPNDSNINESSNVPQKQADSTTMEVSQSNDGKIDPVEKLLSMTCVNDDILRMDENDPLALSSFASISTASAAYPNLSFNFSKLINENLRSYYSRLGKSHMEIHNDNSSFSILNNNQPQQPQGAEEQQPSSNTSQIPFFKNVNFNPSPSFGHRIDDYIYYDLDDEPSSTDSEHEEIPAPSGPLDVPVSPITGKMSFHYRQNDNVNLSLSDCQNKSHSEPHDIFKFMKKRSVIAGKASEMIGTSNFLINDFFF